MERIQMSEEKYKALQDELLFLKTKKMPEIVAAIEEARGHGDLSENAEYDAAKDAQANTAARIAEIEATLENADVLDKSSIDTSAVNLGVIVTVTNVDTKKSISMRIVGATEASINEVPICVTTTSPVGAALLGHKKGETVEAHTPGGTVKFKITKITK